MTSAGGLFFRIYEFGKNVQRYPSAFGRVQNPAKERPLAGSFLFLPGLLLAPNRNRYIGPMFIAATIVISAMLVLQSVWFLVKSARLAKLRLLLDEVEERMLALATQNRGATGEDWEPWQPERPGHGKTGTHG